VQEFQVDLDSWKVRIRGLLRGGGSVETQVNEPGPVCKGYFEDEEDMFGYLMGQHLASLHYVA
jgi:hypothetical protein